MLVQNPRKFRRLVSGRCKYCSRRFFYRRDNRPKFFCDDACRQSDFRKARADFRHASLYPSQRNESPQKGRIKSKTSKRDFADRPLNILGGHRWNGRSSQIWGIPQNAQIANQAIDRETLAAIIETEIGERRFPNPASAPNPYLNQIPADLSIPAFLKRGPK